MGPDPRSPPYAFARVPIRLLIGEDHYLVREGVRRLLESSSEVDVVAACTDLPSLESAVLQYEPDVVLTDIRMPPSDTDEGIRLSEWLRQVRPSAGVVVLSQYAEAAYALALFERGSTGRAYLLKERVFDLAQLLHAIQEVAHGGSVIDPKVVEELVAARSRTPEPLLDSLTPRERQVLSEVAEGHNNAAIAGELFLTERAVEKHINSIFSKLNLSEAQDVHRRVKAVLLFLSKETSEPDDR
jgi:DNA-binding NarL/FixJ family response regulator